MIYPAQKVQILLFKIEKVPKSVLIKYLDFVDIFLEELTTELHKHLSINIYIYN